MEYANRYRREAELWLKEMELNSGFTEYRDTLSPEDALAVLCRMLERGYQRAQTVTTRARWLRLVCGYLLVPSALTSEDAETQNYKS